MRTLLALPLVAACSHPAPPEAPTEPVVVIPVKPIGVERVDEPAFLAMLKRDDWADMIDPELGLVWLTDSTKTSGRRDQTHQIDLHRFCSHRRAALAAKFEALDLAAALIADSSTRNRCLGFQRAEETGLEIECHYDGRLKNFRFARHGSRYVLIGVATVSENAISSADEQRYDEVLRGHCDPRDRDRPDSVDDVLRQGSIDEPSLEQPDPSQHQPDPSINDELE